MNLDDWLLTHPDYPSIMNLKKMFKKYGIEWFMLGYRGICHYCNMEIYAPFKFVRYHIGGEYGSDWIAVFCYPLKCQYCNGDHYRALLFADETEKRRGEKICLTIPQ